MEVERKGGRDPHASEHDRSARAEGKPAREQHAQLREAWQRALARKVTGGRALDAAAAGVAAPGGSQDERAAGVDERRREPRHNQQRGRHHLLRRRGLRG